jgi:hypothetical protein
MTMGTIPSAWDEDDDWDDEDDEFWDDDDNEFLNNADDDDDEPFLVHDPAAELKTIINQPPDPNVVLEMPSTPNTGITMAPGNDLSGPPPPDLVDLGARKVQPTLTPYQDCVDFGVHASEVYNEKCTFCGMPADPDKVLEIPDEPILDMDAGIEMVEEPVLLPSVQIEPEAPIGEDTSPTPISEETLETLKAKIAELEQKAKKVEVATTAIEPREDVITPKKVPKGVPKWLAQDGDFHD